MDFIDFLGRIITILYLIYSLKLLKIEFELSKRMIQFAAISRGVPPIFELKNNRKGDEVFKADRVTIRHLLVETLEWWIKFIHDCTLFEHGAIEDDSAFHAHKKLRTVGSSPKSTAVSVITRCHDGWRDGQLGQWMWVERL